MPIYVSKDSIHADIWLCPAPGLDLFASFRLLNWPCYSHRLSCRNSNSRNPGFYWELGDLPSAFKSQTITFPGYSALGKTHGIGMVGNFMISYIIS